MKTLYNNFEPALFGRLFVLKCGIASAVGSVASSIINADTQRDVNNQNVSASRENMQFQASQAEVNRLWLSDQNKANQSWQEKQNKQNQLWQESMVDKQNQWNEMMWNRTNEYNSPSAQLQRAKDAGINPNFVLGGNISTAQTMSSSSAPSASLPSANLPSGSSPSGSMPTISNSNPWNFGDIAGSILKLAQAKKTKEETKSQMTYNQFASRIHEMGLKQSDAEIAKSYSDISVNDQKIQNMQNEVAKNLATIANINADTRLKAIDEYYKSKEYEASIDNVIQDTGLKKAQVTYMMAKLPSEIRHNNATAMAAEAQAELTKHEIAQCDALVSILETQGQSDRWDLIMKYRYDKDMHEQALNSAEYKNSWLNRGLDGFSKFIGSVATGVGIYAAGKGMKANKLTVSGGQKQFLE